MTNRHLARMGVDHFIVVEEQEADQYRAVVERATVLVLDPSYKARYERCDDSGPDKSTGSGPARNFAWDHSVASGFERHWVMDDNINGFFRFNYNLKTPCVSPAFWRAMEDFVDRFEDVAMAGPNYFMFVSRKSLAPAFVVNTRIFSCNLIRNDLPFQWRARFNEDLDLSIRILKAGLCTVLFNAFLQFKMPTQSVPGGNTTEMYGGGTREKSEMIERLHPECVRTSFRFSREHHYADFSPWKLRLPKRRAGLPEFPEVDNYGMELQQKVGDDWVKIDRPLSEKKRNRYADSFGDRKETV